MQEENQDDFRSDGAKCGAEYSFNLQKLYTVEYFGWSCFECKIFNHTRPSMPQKEMHIWHHNSIQIWKNFRMPCVLGMSDISQLSQMGLVRDTPRFQNSVNTSTVDSTMSSRNLRLHCGIILHDHNTYERSDIWSHALTLFKRFLWACSKHGHILNWRVTSSVFLIISHAILQDQALSEHVHAEIGQTAWFPSRN